MGIRRYGSRDRQGGRRGPPAGRIVRWAEGGGEWVELAFPDGSRLTFEGTYGDALARSRVAPRTEGRSARGVPALEDEKRRIYSAGMRLISGRITTTEDFSEEMLA